MEAADEICRQLRLRDMGGLVINDLIDMRHSRNRKAVEQRFTERLGRDRAKSTILPISEFGILEMTRQRMRSSHERTHFAECHLCKGRGVLRRPDSVAAEALRDLALIASYDKISRVEMVVSAQVASHLLSGRRKQLSRIERTSGTITEVRVSETMATERFVLHGYDDKGNDVDLDKLPKMPNPEDMLVDAEGLIEDMDVQTIAPHADEEDEVMPEVEVHPIELDVEYDEDDEQAERSGRRRKRRRRRRRGGSQTEDAPRDEVDTLDDEADSHDVDDAEDVNDRARHDAEDDEDRPARKRRRRRRRGGRGRGRDSERAEASDDDDGDSSGEDNGSLARRLATALASPDEEEEDQDTLEDADEARSNDSHADGAEDDRPRRRRRRRRRGSSVRETESAEHTESESDSADEQDTDGSEVHTDDQSDDDQPRRRRRRRRRGGSRAEARDEDSVDASTALDEEELEEQIEQEVEPVDEDEIEAVAEEDEPVEAEPATSGLIEPQPKRGRRARDSKPRDEEDEAAGSKTPSKPRPRFLYAAHRRTKSSGPDGG